MAVYGQRAPFYIVRMNITLLGPGRIGSAIAYHLAGAGHAVTVVARGQRLRELSLHNAIVTTTGELAPIQVSSALDATHAADLLIVTMPEWQVLPLLPQLRANHAKAILLMFNTFRGMSFYQAEIGAERLAFGFPNMIAMLDAGQLRCKVDGPGMVSTMSHAAWADLFKSAGLPSEIEADMDSFLLSHAAMVTPIFIAALLTWQRKTNLSWAEARQLNLALAEALQLVRQRGHTLKPRAIALLPHLPAVCRSALLWLFCRAEASKQLGVFGPAETRHLIDTMAALGDVPQLLRLRP